MRNPAFSFHPRQPRDYVTNWPATWPSASTEYRQGFQVGMRWMEGTAARCEVPEPPYDTGTAERDAWLYGFNSAMQHAEELRNAA